MIYESTMSNRLTDAGVGRMSLWKTLQTVITRVVENGKLRAGLLFLFVFHAVGIVFVASRQGPGMSSDSVFYASAARAFAATGELVTYSGAPLAAWPPGFPLTLGWAIRLGLDLESFATALNLACVALVVLLTYQLAVVTLKSSGLALLSALLVSAAASTVRVFSMLWTEPVFAVLVLVTLVVLAHAAGEMETNWYWLLIVAVAVTVATLFRFAGFALIPVVALGVALAFRRRGWIRAVSIGFAAAVAASVGMLLVLYRNLLLGGSLLGTRAPNPHSARQILWASFADLSQYLLPVKTALATEVGILIAVLLLFAVWRIVRARNLGLLVVAAFVVIYWPFLWYSAFSAGIDLPNERLTSPIHGRAHGGHGGVRHSRVVGTPTTGTATCHRQAPCGACIGLPGCQRPWSLGHFVSHGRLEVRTVGCPTGHRSQQHRLPGIAIGPGDQGSARSRWCCGERRQSGLLGHRTHPHAADPQDRLCV